MSDRESDAYLRGYTAANGFATPATRGPLTAPEIEAEWQRLRQMPDFPIFIEDLILGIRFAERMHGIPGVE